MLDELNLTDALDVCYSYLIDEGDPLVFAIGPTGHVVTVFRHEVRRNIDHMLPEPLPGEKQFADGGEDDAEALIRAKWGDEAFENMRETERRFGGGD